MHEIIIPKEIKFSEITENFSLSPNNYKKLAIANQNTITIKSFLDEETPYTKGKEPGSGAYVKKSEQIFLRNSCINDIQFSVNKEKYIYLNPIYYDEAMVRDGDILFCTDANIGDCCFFISDNEKVTFSSGIIKLNFKEEKYKYYVMAFMRDEYFKMQLDAKAPKGATIRHSGDLFLECIIPVCPEEWVYELVENLVKNIAYSEYTCGKKLKQTEKIIYDELMVTKYDYVNPTFKRLQDTCRLDSGMYSNIVFQWMNNVKNYKNGHQTLEEFGFQLKRGPNLAKRDLGRSLQSDTFRKGYNVLIYPSDISDSGYIEKVSYLGARNPIWFLKKDDILFSAEGTVGKTFIICDDSMKFTTNFHGTIVSPIKDEPLRKSIFLGLYLNFLKSIGVFSKLSVGGNGGSFAVGYWHNILIPLFDDTIIKQLQTVYTNSVDLNEFEFKIEAIQKAGIFELNSFLIKCKSSLKMLCEDLKNGKLKAKEYYSI